MYQTLAAQLSDYEQKGSTEKQRSLPYTLINETPFDVEILDYKSKKVILEIDARGSYRTSKLMEDDIIVPRIKGEEKFLTRPYVIQGFEKRIAVGTTVYDPFPSDPNFRSGFVPEEGITGITLSNMLPFPVDIYVTEGYNNRPIRLIGHIDGYDVKTNRHILYLNNSWDGFRIGDVITVKVNSRYARYANKVLYNFPLIDIFQKEIRLGVTNPK